MALAAGPFAVRFDARDHFARDGLHVLAYPGVEPGAFAQPIHLVFRACRNVGVSIFRKLGRMDGFNASYT